MSRKWQGKILAGKYLILLGMIAGGNPSIREMRARLGVAIGTVQRMLSRLCDLGLVRWERGHARTLRPTFTVERVE